MLLCVPGRHVRYDFNCTTSHFALLDCLKSEVAPLNTHTSWPPFSFLSQEVEVLKNPPLGLLPIFFFSPAIMNFSSYFACSQVSLEGTLNCRTVSFMMAEPGGCCVKVLAVAINLLDHSSVSETCHKNDISVSFKWYYGGSEDTAQSPIDFQCVCSLLSSINTQQNQLE